MFWWKKKEAAAPKERNGLFSSDIDQRLSRKKITADYLPRTFQRSAEDFMPVDDKGNQIGLTGMDAEEKIAFDQTLQQAKRMNSTFGENVNGIQLGWYASQGFIGYQVAAMLSQHWLIDKVLTMPARDAARNGYDLAVTDGSKIKPEVLDYIKKRDKEMLVPKALVEIATNNRRFGIRIVMFKIKTSDPTYYEKPFNPDGITKGSYLGYTQIDPYWVTPELDMESAADPSSMYFYEPTWWRITGRRIHRSHLVIIKNGEVPDILKPSYLYGGIPVPQKIYERVYAAEITANEAPKLAMSKRLTVLKLDLTKGLANITKFLERMNFWTEIRDNQGVKIVGEDEEIEQFDTSLNDLDVVIMTQYQIVCAAGDCPATKILGTTPKGFNATGEYEESSYHEFLESVQTHDMTPFLDRHHLLLIRSEVAPKFGIGVFNTEVNWRPIDSPTAAELADINLAKAQTDVALVQTGGIDGLAVTDRLINDRDSGYQSLGERDPADIDEDEDSLVTGPAKKS